MRLTNVIFISLLSLFAVFYSCSNDQQQDHAAALPHNRPAGEDSLSKADQVTLAGAKGRSSKRISSSGLEKMTLKDTSAVMVVNFWQKDCQACLSIQQSLQTIQQYEGRGKLKVISVNLNPDVDSEQVNLTLRTTGITTPVFQLTGHGNQPQISMVPYWNGRFPAFALFSEGELMAFYQREFSKNELVAILQPYFL